MILFILTKILVLLCPDTCTFLLNPLNGNDPGTSFQLPEIFGILFKRCLTTISYFNLLSGNPTK